MYQVVVVSPLFEGKSLVQQHRLVKELLREEIRAMHGLVLNTYTPKKWADAQS
jgi:stress-induced morphogen